MERPSDNHEQPNNNEHRQRGYKRGDFEKREDRPIKYTNENRRKYSNQKTQLAEPKHSQGGHIGTKSQIRAHRDIDRTRGDNKQLYKSQ